MNQEQKAGFDFQPHIEPGRTRIDPQLQRQEESHRRATSIDQSPPDLGVMRAGNAGIAGMQLNCRRLLRVMEAGTTGGKTAVLGNRHLSLGWALMMFGSTTAKSLKPMVAAITGTTTMTIMARAKITMATIAEDHVR